MKSVVLMFIYALVLLFGGYTAFILAPQGATRVTAILIPGVAAALMIVAGVLVLRAKKSTGLARIGMLLGVALPILFGGAFAMRALSSTGASTDFRNDLALFDELVSSGEKTGTIEDFRDFRQFQLYKERVETPEQADALTYEDFKKTRAAKKVKTYDTAYLAAVLWGLCGSSLFAVIAIASTKPTIESQPEEESEEE